MTKLNISEFAAIDFETADRGRDSACAVAVVRVRGTSIIERTFSYIRPPRKSFDFTYLHGISWDEVSSAPSFEELWPVLKGKLDGVDFVAAHNSGFDRTVMNLCCQAAQIERPEYNYLCTMRLARKVWNLYPTKLPDVCKYLNLPLRHHDAGSDAEACAKIVIAAIKADAVLV